MSESRKGFLLGIAAYAMWGLFPLYWPLLEPSGALELLAHRVFWSFVVVSLLIWVTGRIRRFRAVLTSRRELGILAAAAVIITANWGTYIWGVINGHVVETSLGYFINPLVTLLLGVVVLSERLRPVQWVAMAIAAVAVVVLTVDYGHLPYISLTLAFSFGTYGLLKKKANVGAIEGLGIETLILGPIALGYLVWLSSQGQGTFFSEPWWHDALLINSGVITAIPLLCFGAAATRVPMSTLGIQQYLAPTLQMLIGLTVMGETMTPVRWIGFILVWIALVVFTVDSVRNHRRRQLALTVEAAAV